MEKTIVKTYSSSEILPFLSFFKEDCHAISYYVLFAFSCDLNDLSCHCRALNQSNENTRLYSLRSWRYCVGARLKFWRRSRVPKKASRDEAVDGSAVKSQSTILQRFRRQISLDYYTIPPATQVRGCTAVRANIRHGISRSRRIIG